MKSKKSSERLLDILGKADEKYIAEAAEINNGVKVRNKSGSRRIGRAALIAACLAICACAVPVVMQLSRTEQVISPSPETDASLSGEATAPASDETAAVTEAESGETIDHSSEFVVQNGVLLSYNGTDTSVTIPDNVTMISSDAFANNASASSITKLSTNKVIFEKDSLSKLTALECIEILNATESDIEGELATAFDRTAAELASNGVGLKCEYVKDGGTPIYSVTGTEGILFAFGDRDHLNPLTGNEKPTKIFVYTDSVKLPNGLYAGMTSENAAATGVEWEDIYFDCDTPFYYTVDIVGDLKYTCAWEMEEEKFSSWGRIVGGLNGTYKNYPEEYIRPYSEGDLGPVNFITVEKVCELGAY